MTAPRKIRVMALVPSMRTGGAERVISLLLQRLDRALFEPELTIVYDRDIAYQIPDDVLVHVLERHPDTPPAPHLQLPAELESRYAGDTAWLSSIAGKLAAVVESDRPDIIISSPLWASILAVFGHDAFTSAPRLVNRVDAPPSVSLAQSELHDLFAHLMRTRFNTASRVIAVSKAVGRDLVENFGVDESRITVVHNPVDIARIQDLAREDVEHVAFNSGLPVVLFVGRLERVKGLEYFLRAMAKVMATTPAECVLVGDGSHRGYLQALAKHLGIAQHTHFLGRHANPFRFMSRATAFVLPSLSEGMPNVLIEAMTCGCPVVATDIAGGISREVLDEGRYGTIVPRADADALAEGIERMLLDEDARRGFAERGLIRAEEFDLPKIMELNQQLLLEVAQQPTAPLRIVPPVASTPPPAGSNLVGSPPSSSERLRAFASKARAVLRSRLGSTAVDIASVANSRAKDPSKVRLLVVVPSLADPYIGTGLATVLETLDRQRFDVWLARMDAEPRSCSISDEIAQITLSPSADISLLPDDLEPAGVTRQFGDQARRIAGLAGRLAHVSRGVEADAVLAVGFYAGVVAAMARAASDDGPCTIVSMHSRSHDFVDVGSGGPLYMALMRRHFPAVDAVIAPNEAIGRDLVEKFGIREGVLHVLPDPVQLAPEAAPSSEGASGDSAQRGLTFAIAAGSTADEGMRYGLQAVALARRLEHVKGVVVGTGSAMREPAAEAGVQDGLEFVERDQAVNVLHAINGLVYTSVDAESHVPAAVLDAVAAKRAIVATASSDALVEFLGGGERGIVVPMRDAQALADAMLQLVWDDDARRAMVDKAHDYLQSVSGEVVVPRYAELIDHCVRQRAEGSAGE